MRLPEYLQSAIDKITENLLLKDLSFFSHELSERYREGKFISADGHRMAYLISRFPATFAAISKVLQEVQRRAPNLIIKTLGDVGAGPGTAMWASLDVFNGIEKCILYEKDKELIRLGKLLALEAGNAQTRTWHEADLKGSFGMEGSDLVIMSYAIGEIPSSYWLAITKKLWENAEKLLVIIEPGTPAGFERIRIIREMLISFGAKVVAPCPHENKCPMEKGDWCHFDVRLERSFKHRHVKEGSLGYEDEKFSYVAVSKQNFELPLGKRILRHPLKRPGNIAFTFCAQEGLIKEVVTKKDKKKYTKARKRDWGDWVPDIEDPSV